MTRTEQAFLTGFIKRAAQFGIPKDTAIKLAMDPSLAPKPALPQAPKFKMPAVTSSPAFNDTKINNGARAAVQGAANYAGDAAKFHSVPDHEYGFGGLQRQQEQRAAQAATQQQEQLRATARQLGAEGAPTPAAPASDLTSQFGQFFSGGQVNPTALAGAPARIQDKIAPINPQQVMTAGGEPGGSVPNQPNPGIAGAPRL